MYYRVAVEGFSDSVETCRDRFGLVLGRQMLYCTGLATIQDDIAIAARYKDFLKPQSL